MTETLPTESVLNLPPHSEIWYHNDHHALSSPSAKRLQQQVDSTIEQRQH